MNSLRVRIAAAVLLIFTPVFVLVLVSSATQQRLALERAEADAQALAQVLAADNRQYVESTKQLLTTLGRLGAVREKDAQACNAFFLDLFDDLTMYVSIFVVDVDTGLNICASIPPDRPLDNSQFAWYQQVLSTGDLVVSEYRIGPASGRPVVTVGLPVYNEGELTAVVAAGMSLEWLNASLRTTQLPSGSTVTLVDRDGTILARYPATEGQIGSLYRNTRVLNLTLDQKVGTVQAPDHEGIARLYAFTQLGPEEGEISVIVGVPEATVLADANTTRDRSLVALIGITLFVVALSWLASGLVVRPVRNLTLATRGLAQGRLDSRTSLTTDIVELQQLLDAFNDMASAVEHNILERISELSAANVKLEHEIAVRTQAQARSRILQELTAGLSEAMTTNEVSSVIVEKGLIPLGGHLAAIAITNGDAPTLRLLRHSRQYHPADGDGHELNMDAHRPLLDAFRTGKPVWIETPDEFAARYPEMYQAVSAEPESAQSVASLPLVVGRHTVGSISVYFPEPQVMDDDFQALLYAVSDYCAQALERARLYEQELRARQAAEAATTRIARLHAVTAALADAFTAEEVGQIVVEQGTLVLSATVGSFHLLADRGANIKMISNVGGRLSHDAVQAWQQYPADPSYPVADAIRRKTILWYQDLDDFVAHYPAMADYATDYPGGLIILPILLRGDGVGAISFGFADPQRFDDEDHLFMVALTHQAAMALERARLAQQAQQTAVLQERQRLARDLHDAVSQTLFSSTLIAEALVRQWERSPQKAVQRLNQLIILNRGAMAEMRALLFELRPEALEKTELKDLLSQLIDAAQGRKRVKAELSIEGDGASPVPTDVHVALYRIAQESVNNIIKHSKASEFRMELVQEEGLLTLLVSDNGQGFDSTNASAGIGLESMRERAEGIGATLEIVSAPGSGTQVRVHWAQATAEAPTAAPG